MEPKCFLPFRVVAQYADGSRLAFSGLTMDQAKASMEAAQKDHGDISYWNTVTDEHYENGRFYKIPADDSGLTIATIETASGSISFEVPAPYAGDVEKAIDDLLNGRGLIP